uniref:Zona pellucida sperm-binding protein 4 n=1 Tax=Myripristis murdjan TaxID=586833 RepID=A0A667XU31_9TELE
MKWISVCLVAVAVLGLSDYTPQPQPPPPKYTPPQPQQPQQPQQPELPQQPQQPQLPQQPQQPQLPQQPQQPQQPQLPQQPQPPPKKPQTPPSESFHTCEVDNHYKIQCGPAGISASECDAINCCFDGQMCYYGKAVTLQCTKDAQFILVVARDATLPNIDLESVALLGEGQGCTPVGTTSAFAIYQFPVTACGTVMMEEPGVIIYENRMSSSYEVGVGPLGAITRDSTYDADTLAHQLRLWSLSSFYTDADYPVTKVLRDPVYVEVRMLERTDPNLVLTLGRCWATCDSNPYSLPQWDLLIDGCPYSDDRYLTSLVPVDSSSGLAYPTHHRRFIFKMFTFVDQTTLVPLREKVYIHCNTAVCQPSAGNNCEPRCFRQRRDIAAAVQKTTRSETTMVSSGEVIMIDPTQTERS